MQDSILITGGAGFIGSRLASALVDRDYQVTVLDNLSHQIHGQTPEKSYLYKSLPPTARFIRGDVTSAKSWQEALEKQTVVVHLAAETGTGQSMYEIEKYSRVNIGGTAILMDELVNRRHTIKKVIVASSRAVYGEGKYLCPQNGAVYPESRDEKSMLNGDFSVKCPKCSLRVNSTATDENSELKPGSVYGLTKMTQEQLVSMIGRATGISTIGLRYQNVYGPGQSLNNPYTGILPIFASALANGDKINVFEDGAPSRDFVYIDDVVDATVSAIEVADTVDDVFNVGSGTPVDIVTVIRSLEKLLHIEADFEITGEFRSGDIRHNYADLQRVSNALKYSPKWDFQSGLEKFVSWSDTQCVGSKYSESLTEIREKGLLK